MTARRHGGRWNRRDGTGTTGHGKLGCKHRLHHSDNWTRIKHWGPLVNDRSMNRKHRDLTAICWGHLGCQHTAHSGIRCHFHLVQVCLSFLAPMWQHFSTSMRASPASLLLTLPAETSSSYFPTTARKRSERWWWWCVIMSAESGLQSKRRCWMRFGIPIAGPIPLSTQVNIWRISAPSLEVQTILRPWSLCFAHTTTSVE